MGGYSGPGMYGRTHTSIPQSFMAVETVLLVLFDAIGGDGHGCGSADGRWERGGRLTSLASKLRFSRYKLAKSICV